MFNPRKLEIFLKIWLRRVNPLPSLKYSIFLEQLSDDCWRWTWYQGRQMNSASLRNWGTVASSRLSGLLLRVLAKAMNGETMNQCWTGVACKYACKFPQDFSRILEITLKNHSPTLIPEGENLCRAKWLLLILLWVLGEQLWQRSKFCIGGLLNHKSTGIPLSINTDFFSQVWPSIVSKPIKEPI